MPILPFFLLTNLERVLCLVDKFGFDKSEKKRMFLQAKLRTAKKEALLGGWGGGMYIVCLQSELEYNRFHVSSSKPRRYLTHLYVICRHLIKSYVTVLRPSFLLEFLTLTWLPENLQTFPVTNNNMYQLTMLVTSLYMAKKLVH